jgi:hypothetical protein
LCDGIYLLAAASFIFVTGHNWRLTHLAAVLSATIVPFCPEVLKITRVLAQGIRALATRAAHCGQRDAACRRASAATRQLASAFPFGTTGNACVADTNMGNCANALMHMHTYMKGRGCRASTPCRSTASTTPRPNPCTRSSNRTPICCVARSPATPRSRQHLQPLIPFRTRRGSSLPRSRSSRKLRLHACVQQVR